MSQSTDSILEDEQYRRFENNQSLKIQDLKLVLNDDLVWKCYRKRLIEHYKEIVGKMKIKDYTASS